MPIGEEMADGIQGLGGMGNKKAGANWLCRLH
jgi:hypothetical protein